MAVEQLKQGRPAVGTMVRIVDNPACAWIVKHAGLEFYMYDMEHGTFSVETLSKALTVARGAGVDGFVRVPELSKAFVSGVLDAGATGVMVPMLETVEQARKLAEWAKFAPVGKRGLGTLGAHTNYGGLGGTPQEFMEQANRETLTIAQIETGTGVENVEAIAATDGIDALLIGPNDLAISLGVSGDLLGDTVNAAIEKVVAAVRNNGKVFGLHAPDALLERWIPKGCNLIMSGLDLAVLTNGLKAIAEKYKK